MNECGKIITNELKDLDRIVDSRTLKKALDRMQDNGIIHRKMSSGLKFLRDEQKTWTPRITQIAILMEIKVT